MLGLQSGAHIRFLSGSPRLGLAAGTFEARTNRWKLVPAYNDVDNAGGPRRHVAVDDRAIN